MNPRLGLILLFEGDYRKMNAVIDNITTFSAVSAALKQGDTDVTSTYINSTIDTDGNIIYTDNIGEKASIPPGNYRYFITGVHDGKTDTWYWDVLVLPKDLSLLEEFPLTDYNPEIKEINAYEGDVLSRSPVVLGAEFSAVTGVLKLGSDETPTTSYCSGAANYSGAVLTTHSIGGLATVQQGQYGYFLTGTYNNGEAKTTYFYRINYLPKQSIL